MTIPKVHLYFYAIDSVFKKIVRHHRHSLHSDIFSEERYARYLLGFDESEISFSLSEQHVENVNVSMGEMRIQGFLSLEGAQSKVLYVLILHDLL